MSQPSTTAAPRSDEPDPRNSLRHVLAADPPNQDMPDAPTPVKTEAGQPPAQDDPDSTDDPKSKPADEQPMYTATTTTTRRNANGSVSSVYSGNKIRHLKKEDGVPLWRKDIQYDFLRNVFDDQTRVFHKVSDGTDGHTFADIYLDAMAKSSKCSKILKDKLLTERAAAINMAMVCLLVNVGRMNTTLNCRRQCKEQTRHADTPIVFPEMRAQLRTYHSIPSLQAHQDPNAYKQLQDAPRLKSILKGATEDTQQPSTIEEIKNAPVPRTNPVNLIFVLAQYAPKISELHFFPPRDFFDLVMRSALSSESRAKAFLWLMWWYLESDFTEHDAMNNPFGPGQPGTSGDATGGMPIKTPPFKHLTEEEATLENVDTEEEKVFGEEKRKERIAILATDMAPVVTGPKRGIKKGFTNNPVFSVASDDGSMTPGRDHQSPGPGSFRSSGRAKAPLKALQADYGSDTDRTRSASPPSVAGYPPRITPNMRINNLLNDDGPSTPQPPQGKGPGRGNWGPRSKGTPSSVGGSARHPFKAHLDAASPSVALGGAGPHGFYLPLNGTDPSVNRKRPPTAHQMAVEQHRKKQVDYILDRKLRTQHREAERRRKREGTFSRAWKRLKLMPDGYDSEEEFYAAAALAAENGVLEHSPVRRPMLEATRLAGLTPIVGRLELDDCGEEMTHWARIFRQTGRRLDRWEGNPDAVPVKKRKDRAEREKEAAAAAAAAAAASAPTPQHDLVWVGEDAGTATPGTVSAPTGSARAGRRAGGGGASRRKRAGVPSSVADSTVADVSERGDGDSVADLPLGDGGGRESSAVPTMEEDMDDVEDSIIVGGVPPRPAAAVMADDEMEVEDEGDAAEGEDSDEDEDMGEA
ncbi:Ino eighty subunit 1 [Diplodia seriata]|uniref:Ino eighty subunit 1 n=2 Tax=Diplodia seriata TaxID=420778 RepID=A0A1S8B9M3_9PEZI|nr:Ino eighty subunit 1 [Diplodia seriata]